MKLQVGETLRAEKGQTVGPLRWEPDGWFYVQGKRGCWLPDGTPQDDYTTECVGSLVSEGPVRTETATTRRIVPGVYGRLEVTMGATPDRVRVGLTSDVNNKAHWVTALTATELDELAMVASQLAEALRDA